ncbi:MAG: hypothetical protein ABTR07_15260 [Candidatus Competibacter denitrificans]
MTSPSWLHFRRQGIRPICGAVITERYERLRLTIDPNQVDCPECKRQLALPYQSRRYRGPARDYR